MQTDFVAISPVNAESRNASLIINGDIFGTGQVRIVIVEDNAGKGRRISLLIDIPEIRRLICSGFWCIGLHQNGVTARFPDAVIVHGFKKG
ncbi:hypothetical protein [Pantoea ananatis]|uniref:hypothetical protein n=1 Tax=Pantoea ananas TaxID=553 RepID=UPI0005A4F468|nr:hypothetical protein [Pantoea ananatis]AMB76806.1 hypothetical protein AW734_19505 [Pantoea ananatis]